MLSKILETICHEASDLEDLVRKQSYVLKVSAKPLMYGELRYLTKWRDGHPYSNYLDEEFITLDKEFMFGADNFKSLCGMDLPDDIATFYSRFPILGDFSCPVISDFDWNDFRNSDVKRLIYPEKIARIYLNKWDDSVNFYTKRGNYNFKKRKMLPILEMDDGYYVEHSFAKNKSGIYFCDNKIANNMDDLIIRLCINPDFFIPLENRVKNNYQFRDFTQHSEIPWDYLRKRYG